jgi:hypothetical protein
LPVDLHLNEELNPDAPIAAIPNIDTFSKGQRKMGQIGVYTCFFEVFEPEMLFPEYK